MSGEKIDMRSRAHLLSIIEEQRARLEEAEQTLQAIRSGEVDAVIVDGPQGEQVFSRCAPFVNAHIRVSM